MIGPGSAHLGAQVSALLDGQLTREQADRAWAHAAECESCRAAVQREQWVKQRLSGLASCAPPAGPPVRLTAALSSLAAGPTIHGRWPEPVRRRLGARLTAAAIGVGTLSASFLVLGAGYLAESSAETDDPPTPTGLLPSNAFVADLSNALPTISPRPVAYRDRPPWARMEP